MPVTRSRTSPAKPNATGANSNASAQKPTTAPSQATTARWNGAVKLPGVSAQIRELGTIAYAARTGSLNPAQVEAKLAKLPALPQAEGDVLWSAGGASKRAEYIAVCAELASAAPNSHLPANPVNGHRPTTKENLLQLQFVDAQASRDGVKMKAVAREFAKQFPASPTNTWVQDLAARS